MVVDEQLEGECMRLRPSMNKYTAKDQEEAEIEIAKAFIHPGTARLCRCVMCHISHGASDVVTDKVSQSAHRSAGRPRGRDRRFHKIAERR